MEEGVPTVSVSGVASRFVSQDDIEAAKARREEQWKAAYARLGQEPPPRPTEDSFDGRSLAEKLAANRAAKQEEWEERTKLANQFRALEEDEIMFLDSIREKQAEEERLRKAQDGEELSDFRKAVAARENAINKPLAVGSQAIVKSTSDTDDKTSTKTVAAPSRREAKKTLKGVVVKKKVKLQPSTEPTRTSSSGETKGQPDSKRRRISTS
ncbi:N-terminal domain of NEFA-interacting nuclear protein NIP30-domain-containing protein [Phlebopus sp. FC_14]|nr:N-terminal domain of NEFA-interacting nuclear protein NIP30-domain-containing protein [Phlebopus sp. FC_14]